MRDYQAMEDVDWDHNGMATVIQINLPAGVLSSGPGMFYATPRLIKTMWPGPSKEALSTWVRAGFIKRLRVTRDELAMMLIMRRGYEG